MPNRAMYFSDKAKTPVAAASHGTILQANCRGGHVGKRDTCEGDMWTGQNDELIIDSESILHLVQQPCLTLQKC